MSDKVPQIRFKGFDDEWEKRIFSSLMSHLSNNTLSRAELNCSQGEMQDVHYGDILVKFGEILDARKESLPYFNDCAVAQKFEKAALKDGDIIIADTAEDETAGKCVELIGVGENKISAGLHTMPCRPNQKFSPRYLGYYMNSPAYHNQLFKYMQGTKVVSISKSALSETIIRNPSSDKEQSKIGSYFEKLDTLIDGKQKKLEKLKNLKQAYLDKMFPKKGSKVPEVRFKGFSGDWDEDYFDDLYSKVSEKNDFTYGTDKIISVANMYFKKDSYISDKNYLLTYNVFKLGDIAFEGNKSKDFKHGRFVENSIGDGIVSHVFEVFRPKVDYDLLYWKYAINNERLMGPILIRCTKQSTMMTNLAASDFLKQKVLHPSVPEQRLIGAFFQNLDNLIALQQQELEKLKNIKSACLQKMFV